APADWRPGRNHQRFLSHRSLQTTCQLRPRDARAGLKANRPALISEKRAQPLQTERSAKLGVVPQPGMRIERQVRAVNRQIALQQQTQQLVALLRPGMRGSPEQPV